MVDCWSATEAWAAGTSQNDCRPDWAAEWDRREPYPDVGGGAVLQQLWDDAGQLGRWQPWQWESVVQYARRVARLDTNTNDKSRAEGHSLCCLTHTIPSTNVLPPLQQKVIQLKINLGDEWFILERGYSS